MTKVIAIALITLGLSTAAQARPDSWELTCAEAQGLVTAQGAVVMNYGVGAGGELYERFVAHSGYCYHDETAEAAYVPTADQARCGVGYTCERDINE